MARNRLTRYVAVLWDRNAARQMQAEADAAFQKVAASGSEEFEQGMREGGRKAARTLSRALQQEYRVRMARARLDLAEGTIDEKAFEREGREAAQAFNRGLTGGIRQLRGQGNTDALTLAGLTGQFKREPGVGRAGILGGLALGGFAGPLAGILSAGAVINESREMISAADEMERSVRRLEGTAKLAGVSLDTLQKSAEAAKEELKLGAPIANDLTGVMTRLAARAGDVTQTQGALRGWLDLAAAGGLAAAEAMEALEVTFRGQDEGLNRLGLANPQQIYEKWAEQIGTTASKMDDAQKAQAILNEVVAESQKVQGAWADSMERASGQADQQRQKIRDLQAEAGEAIRPFQLFALELKVGLYTVLGQLIERIGTAISKWREWVKEHRDSSESLRMGMLSGGSRSGLMSGSEAPPSGFDLARIHARPSHLPPATPTPTPLTPEQIAAAAAAAAQRRRLGGIGSVTPGTAGTGPAGDLILSELAPGEVQRDAWAEYVDTVQHSSELVQDAAWMMGNAFSDAFTRMITEGESVGEALEALPGRLAQAAIMGLAQQAGVKIAENVANAFEQFAKAAAAAANPFTAPLAPGYTAAGTAFLAAAGKWALVGGAAGVAGSALSGGGGVASTRDAGIGVARNASPEPASIVLNVDPLNPANPVHAKVVGEAVQLDVRLGGVPVWAGGTRR